MGTTDYSYDDPDVLIDENCILASEVKLLNYIERWQS
jgi:hypothetical protein